MVSSSSLNQMTENLNTPWMRLEGVPHCRHEDHIAARGTNSLSQYKLEHKFYSDVFQALKKFQMQRLQWKKEWGNFERYGHVSLTKVRNKKEEIEGARNKFVEMLLVESSNVGNVHLSTEQEDCSCQCMWTI